MLLEESVITPDQVESPNVHNNVPVSQQCSNDGSGSSSASNTVAKSTLWANLKCELLSFNEPSGKGVTERLDKVHLPRRSDPGVFEANKASIQQKGQLTVREKFHRAPVELPPLPPHQDNCI